jgi:hypothetical protein
MSDTDRHLMTLFSAALDCASAAERAAYLERACGREPALRARVEALLRAHEGAGRFLEPGPAESPTADRAMSPTEAAVAGPEAGAVVAGRYKLLEVIGEGGMGTVWLAEQQEPVRRKVALKVIKRGMDSRQVLARFEAERQALALMDHANIARVLDGGPRPTAGRSSRWSWSRACHSPGTATSSGSTRRSAWNCSYQSAGRCSTRIRRGGFTGT